MWSFKATLTAKSHQLHYFDMHCYWTHFNLCPKALWHPLSSARRATWLRFCSITTLTVTQNITVNQQGRVGSNVTHLTLFLNFLQYQRTRESVIYSGNCGNVLYKLDVGIFCIKGTTLFGVWEVRCYILAGGIKCNTARGQMESTESRN